MKRFWCIGALLICFIAPNAGAQNLASARIFLSKLYDSYEHPVCADCPNVFGKEASHVFSPSLLKLIRKDEAKTPKGEVGALDWDPICACQDPDGLHVLSLSVLASGASRAKADVVVSFSDKSKRIVHLALLQTPRGWRVDDASTDNGTNIRKLLEASIRSSQR